jgi:thioredoxin reductase
METPWDVIVIGGGAAGLSAALMLGRARRRALVIDARAPRNRFAAHMHGVLGHEGVEPGTLLERGREEAASYGVVDRIGAVTRVELDQQADLQSASVAVTLDDGETLRARALVVASGMTDALPEIPGLAERWGDRVLHCPYCHGWEVQDQRLGVVMTSPLSMHQALIVRQWSDRVVAFTAGAGDLPPEALERLRARGIEIVDSAVMTVEGGAAPAPLVVRTTDGTATEVDAVFTGGTPRPHEAFLSHLALDRAENPMGSFIAAGPTGATSDPRIWVAGNVTNPGATVPMAMGAGAMAGAAVNGALVEAETAAVVAALTEDRS